MALSTLALAGVVAVLLTFYKLTTFLLDWNNERQWAKSHGTKPPLQIKNMLPFGLDRYLTLLDSVDRQAAPEWNRSVHERQQKHTFTVNMLGMNNIMTREPRNIQAILATQFKDFSLGPARYCSFFPLLGNGIFTLDGKGWEHSRALLRPQFSRDQISHLESLEDHIQLMFKQIPHDGTPVDLQELFFRLTLDTATEFLFGESTDSLSKNMANKIGVSGDSAGGKMGFAEAFNKSQDYLMQRIRLRSLYWVRSPKEFKECNKVCKDLVDHFVHNAIAAAEKPAVISEKSSKPRYVFIDALAKESKDPILLRDQVMNILLAGRDTTASLLGWTFYLLGHNPNVMQKLREAIKTDFGDEDPNNILTFEQLKACTYLKWVVNETLRLYPVVPFNGRTAVRDTTIPTGGGPDGTSPIFVRNGQQVEYSVYAMQRREDIWGEDANFFRPERWGEARKGGYGGFEYLPFNGGPRICLGQQFALTEASYTIVKMLQHFDRLQLVDFDIETKMAVTLTMCRGGNGTLMRAYKD